MPREKAVRSLTRKVPADATDALRLYVVAPDGTAPQDFAFAVRSLDEKGEADSSETRFEGPETSE